MNLVIFGPPGAGKGTQSKFIVKKYNLFQLSTGELLRDEIINKTELGLQISSIMNSGKLVSDDIVSNLSFKTGFSLILSKTLVNNFFEALSYLMNNNKLSLKNIGTFKLIKKKERIGRNPKTKEEYLIKSRISISFLPSKKLLDVIN